ncbi:hypothetical protein [Sphingobacterium mizutaii]|uniref:hypothetical protein n=1 Tax=Sphingobacterium mizutaii TaxID=1010 RepID=UPI0016282586|nr:hypothetical protein [Sphingobacterium mizutaii]
MDTENLEQQLGDLQKDVNTIKDYLKEIVELAKRQNTYLSSIDQNVNFIETCATTIAENSEK